VTRFLLDTNVISNATKAVPSEALAVWFARQSDDDLFISTMTLAEIQRGILEKSPGRKRELLERWFTGRDGLQALFAGRILPFDENAALIWGRLMAEGTATGRPRSGFDMMIAAIAEANDCVVATENEKDFAAVPFVNPMKAH
jgi:toxin FitB